MDAAIQNVKLKGFAVLVVEDDEDTRDALRAMLELHGATVHVAGTAVEGLHALLQLRPDVLVCDLGLPGVDGYALIRQVRELPLVLGGSTAAVAVTAYAAEMTTKVLHAGFQAHLQKPVAPEDLVTTVAALGLKGRQ
jgi:CheY-like chemotaxis protein